MAKTVAPLRVIRSFIEDPAYQSIGGDVQVGFAIGSRFERISTAQPRVYGKPAGVQRVNNIDLAELGGVGPCHIGIMAFPG